MKFLIVVLLLNSSLKADDLLSGYSSLISQIKPVEVEVKQSIERSYKESYEYLFFVFMNGVNDLGILGFSISDINEMEMVGSTDKVAVVVEHNSIERTREGIVFKAGANTYFIRKDPNDPYKDRQKASSIVSEVINYTPDGDMGSAKHLAVSVKKAIKRFKPQKLILVIWNHGNGYFGISYDDVSGNNMSVQDLAYALEEIKKYYGRKIDILAMDACLMQMAEVIAQIKDYANFIIASQEYVPGTGYPYDEILKRINSSSSIKDAAIGIVEEFVKAYDEYKSNSFGVYSDNRVTLSVIDTSKYRDFISILNRWVKKALKSSDFSVITSSKVKEDSFFFLKGVNAETVQWGYSSTESEGIMTRTVDLVDYLMVSKMFMKDETLKKETDALIDFIKKEFVVYHKGGDTQNSKAQSYKKRTHGVAIYLPKLRYNTKYESLKFAKESLWDEFLKGDLSDEITQNQDYNFHSSGSSKGYENDDEKKDEKTSSKVEPLTIQNKIIETFTTYITQNQNQDTSITIPNKNYLTTYLSHSTSKTSHDSITNTNHNISSLNSINVYSTSYTSKKTIVPTEENLISFQSISEDKEVKENIKEDKQTTQTSIINKSKQAINTITDALHLSASRMKELFIEDKSKKEDLEKLLSKLEQEIIQNLSVSFSSQILNDKKTQTDLMRFNKARTLRLLSYASYLKELDDILSKDYSEEEVSTLSSYLSSTLDRSKPICELDICIPPENLIDKFIKKQEKKYSTSKIKLTEMAIRKWEYVFNEEAILMNWGQARTITISSTSWSQMSIKERNATIEILLKQSLKKGTTTYLKPEVSPDKIKQVEKRIELDKAIVKISSELVKTGFLKDEELKALRSKPLEEQAYILANLFDRSSIKNNSLFEKDIAIVNANRSSFINEVLDSKNRAILSNYISNNILNELKKSKTASEIYLHIYSKNKKPSIVIDYISKDSSNNGNTIFINASLIEQYLRLKGYNVENLKDEKIRKEILIYISPLIVREMGLIYVNSKTKEHSPNVREKYALSLLYQAKYFEENKNLKSLFSTLYGYTDYANKIDAINRIYRTSDNKYDFLQKAGLRYYSNLPSYSQAKAEMLLSVSKEIEKRSKLSQEERKRIDNYAIFREKDIDKVSVYEIINHSDAFTTSALLKIQQRLLKENNFAKIYDIIISQL